MNKRVLAVTASAFALAAMPVVGVFAKVGDVTDVTDTINITVDASCTLGAQATNTVSETISNGTMKQDLAGTTFSISCNDGTGWHITAKGAGEEESHETDLATSGATATIPTSATIGTETSGWGFKFTGEGVADGYDSFKAVPSSDTKVASGTSPVAKQSLQVTYGVGIDADQAAGTYTGKVTYTLATGPGGPGA